MENGERAVVKDICREVIREDSCPRGNENKNRIINLEKEGIQVNENIKNIFDKLDKTTEKHSKQWQGVMTGIIMILIGMLTNIALMVVIRVFK